MLFKEISKISMKNWWVQVEVSGIQLSEILLKSSQKRNIVENPFLYLSLAQLPELLDVCLIVITHYVLFIYCCNYNFNFYHHWPTRSLAKPGISRPFQVPSEYQSLMTRFFDFFVTFHGVGIHIFCWNVLAICLNGLVLLAYGEDFIEDKE